MKTIGLVTHAETQVRDGGKWCPDPAMTGAGLDRIVRLKSSIAEALGGYPTEIHCGTGRRQWQLLQVLGLDGRMELVHVSGLWGDASTIIVDDGKNKVLLGHGQILDYERYDTARHVGGEIIRNVIRTLPHNSLICSGRPVLVRLGMKPEECLSGAVYALAVDTAGQIDIVPKTSGSILLQSSKTR